MNVVQGMLILIHGEILRLINKFQRTTNYSITKILINIISYQRGVPEKLENVQKVYNNKKMYRKVHDMVVSNLLR